MQIAYVAVNSGTCIGEEGGFFLLRIWGWEECERGWEMVARRDIRGRNDERRAFLARFLLIAMSVGSGAE